MYESTPTTVLEWVETTPGNIPGQSVMFGYHGLDGAMFVAQVHDGSETEGGSFITQQLCAEYLLNRKKRPRCTTTFDIIVLKHGEETSMSFSTYNCYWTDDTKPLPEPLLACHQ